MCMKMHRLLLLIFCLCVGTINAYPTILKPECPQTQIRGNNGFVRSLNFPLNYSNSMDCESRITVSKGHQVQLVFYAFETELGSDIVTLYDGAGDNKKEIVQLSGIDPIHNVYKTQESETMTIRFKTDIDHTFGGYYAFYQAVLPSQQQPVLKDCSKTDEFAVPFGVVVSPQWPNEYENKAHCIYKIQLPSEYESVRLRVNFFETEENADIVYIYQGDDTSNLLKKMSGLDTYQDGYSLTVNAPYATIVFISDFDHTYRGFSFTYVGQRAH